MANDTLTVELEVLDGKAEVVIGKNRRLLNDFVADVNNANPKLKFSVAGESFIDLDKLEKRAFETRKKFEEITKIRLDGGKIGLLTQDIVKTSERARQLQSDIAGIKKELLSPNRKSSVAFLTEELKAAEREADQLNRKLDSLNVKNTTSQTSGLTRGRRGSNTEFTRAALEVVDDFVPTGTNRPFNAISKELLAVSTISTTTLLTFGAIAAAAYGIVKVTQNIREEAEKYLKVETAITAEHNKQAKAQKEALYNFAQDSKAAERARFFGRDLQTQSVDQLKNERVTAQKLLDKAPTTGDAERLNKEILQIEARLDEIKQQKIKQADDYFAQRGEGFKKAQEVAIKAEQSNLENNYNVQNALLERNIELGIGKQEQGYSESLRRRQNFISEEINVQARFFDSQLSLYSNDLVKTVEITAERNQTIRKLNTEFRIAEINAQKELSVKTKEFSDFLVSAKSTALDNPFIKLFSDIDTAGSRAQKRFGLLGEEVVKLATAAERANLTKAIGLQNFENNFEALKFRQEARKLAATPESQFADFKRALETVEFKTDALAKIFALDKKIDEADFFAKRFNPNNPKSFEESRFSFAERDRFADVAGNRKRGESLDDFEKRRKEAIDTGIKIFDAIQDVNKFKTFSLEGTGVLGKGIIADKILEAIPNREDLLKQLNSPNIQTRENAQFLLGERSNALQAKKQAEQQKLQDFLVNQKFQEFAKPFVLEQIGLINNDRSLTDAQKAQRRLSVTDALGNDLDPRLKSQRIQDFLDSAQAKEKQTTDAMKIAEDTKKAVENILKALTEKGIKIDQPTGGGGGATLGITIKDETNGAASVLTRSPTVADTAREYDDALRDSNYRIGDKHKAGSLYGSSL